MPKLFFLSLLGISLLAKNVLCATPLNLDGLIQFDATSAGVTTFDFLKLPIGARNIALGGLSQTTDEEATLMHANAAGLSLVENYYYSFSHAEILGEFRHEDVALTYPLFAKDCLGLSLNVLSTTPFANARDIDEQVSNPTASDFAFSLAYGKTLWEGRVAAGTKFNYLHSAIDDISAIGYSIDLSLLFLLLENFRIGLNVRNLSQGVRYDTPTSPLEPLPLSFALEIGKPLLNSPWSGFINMEHNNEGLQHYGLGFELQARPYLLLRMGYGGSWEDRALGPNAGLSAGLGLTMNNFGIDYGYKHFGPLGDYHGFTLNYSHKAVRPINAEEIYAKALIKFQAGDIIQAKILVAQAVAIDPYHWKAQALLQKIQHEMALQDVNAINIFYTGNTHGQLAPVPYNERKAGGLARRKTKLLELKLFYPESILLDAGELDNAIDTLSTSAPYIFTAYTQMPYDAVNVGAGEYRKDWTKIKSLQGEIKIPWLASQEGLANSDLLVKMEKSIHGQKVTILGMSHLNANKKNSDSLLSKQVESISVSLQRWKKKKDFSKTFVILLLDAPLEVASHLAQEFTDLGAIILSGEDEARSTPLKIGNTLMLCSGKDGIYIGHLSLVFDRKHQLVKSNHRLITLDYQVQPDATLKKLLAEVLHTEYELELNPTADDYTSQIFPFINAESPHASGRLYIHDMRNGFEYPLQHQGLMVTQPIFGYLKNSLAFIGGSKDSANLYALPVSLDTVQPKCLLPNLTNDLILKQWHWDNKGRVLYVLLGHKTKDKNNFSDSSDLFQIDMRGKMLNLSKGSFTNISGFDIAPNSNRMSFIVQHSTLSQLYIADLEMDHVTLISDSLHLAGPISWSPDEHFLAFTSLLPDQTLELQVFQQSDKTIFSATQRSQVRDFHWAKDSQTLYYTAGVNLLDLNAFNLLSKQTEKVTGNRHESLRSEEGVFPKKFGNREGLLFEAYQEGHSQIIWMDAITHEEKVLVDMAGFNSLK